MYKKESSRTHLKKKEGKEAIARIQRSIEGLAQKKLVENHNITISVETLRKLMMKHRLHIPKAKMIERYIGTHPDRRIYPWLV